jgi:TetR/AcrR family transcriptional repressor of lmrAB and yxaGH operons
MPAAIITKDEVLSRLLEVFRRDGYDGASLAEISRATGLGKSSLYNHFPGGKEQMALEVLAALGASLERDLFAPLAAAGPREKRLDAMLEAIDAFYDGGNKACLLERLAASVDRRPFSRPLAAAFTRWMGAIEALAIEAGVKGAVAARRAEDAVVRIEGALVVSAAMGETGPFERALADIRATLLEP